MDTPSLIKTLGKPIDTACKLFESLLGQPVEVAGQTVADQIQAWQWSNRVRIAEKVEEKLKEDSIARRVLLPDYLLPLMRDCGDAGDERLQNMWADLLVSAIDDQDAEHVAFLKTINQFSPNDARALKTMLTIGFRKRDERAKAIASELDMDESSVRVSLANFDHLGFFTPSQRGVKSFAVHFMRACFRDDEMVNRYIDSQDKGGGVLVD